MGSSRKTEDQSWLFQLVSYAAAIALGMVLFMYRASLASDSVNPAPRQVAELESLGKCAVGAELPGEIVGWEGYMEAFHLNKVKLEDGRVVQAAMSSRLPRVRNGAKVYVVESVWQDRKSGESFYILTRYR